MASSLIFSRRDGLDALICNDPSFDNTLEKIEESVNDSGGFNMFDEANRLAGLNESDNELENDDSITELLDGDDCYDTCGTDIVDDYADTVHDMGEIPENIDSLEIGDMIDILM